MRSCKIQSTIPVYLPKGDQSGTSWEDGVETAMLCLKKNWHPIVYQHRINDESSGVR